MILKCEERDVPECKDEILSMPGVFRYGYENIVEALRPIVEAGLKSVLLFGVLSHLQKDECATHCDSDFNPVIKSVKLLRKEYPHLIVACDVCLCAYTQHGHCGILRGDGSIDNEKSINRLATQSLAYARADVKDEERVGRLNLSTTDKNTDEVLKMVLINRQINAREVAKDLNKLIGHCHSIFSMI
ncbi:hypothetical protein QYM36_016710 [Artemia franciscana]|uniref:porphobilinogen synthase n=1 Tax=Artemia franciscana TaxID=6661 RepID=A0AA88HBG8_ARTSF|nr:hypothetical protein QYM36_016710 [Artemia franciscana]